MNFTSADWRPVAEAHRQWDYKSQGLTGAGAAIIAIAVTIATQGAGAGALSTLMGQAAAESTVGVAMTQAAISTLASQASVSLINNQGDIGKVLKEMGSSASLRNLAISVVAAGAYAEIGDLTGGHISTSAEAKDFIENRPMDYLANIAGHAAVGCASSAAGGGNCAAGAAGSAVGAAAGPVIQLGNPDLATGTALTAGVGAIGSKVAGGDAATGALNAAAGYLYNHVLGSNKEKPFTDDSDHPVLDINGKPILRPEGADPHIFVELGIGDRSMPGAILADLASFGQGGPLDIQRNFGQHYPQFVDSATVVLGIYAASAGINMNDLLRLQDNYAEKHSNFGNVKMDSVYTHLPEKNVFNTKTGYDLFLSGKVK